MSLATDDFITEGGLGILDDDLLYNEERTDELRNMVVDSYMQMFKETASTSARTNTQKTKTKGGTATERKYSMVMGNIFKGLDGFLSGDSNSLGAYSKGQLLDNGDGTAQMIYNDNVIDIDKNSINEYTIYKILQQEGVPANMIPSLEELRAMISGGGENTQETQEENKDVNYYYSQID